jgi:hypothetical protein
VALVEPTDQDKDCRVFMSYEALVTVHHPVSQSAAATTTPPLFATLLLTCNPQTKSKKTWAVHVLKRNIKSTQHTIEILINTGSYLRVPYVNLGVMCNS